MTTESKSRALMAVMLFIQMCPLAHMSETEQAANIVLLIFILPYLWQARIRD